MKKMKYYIFILLLFLVSASNVLALGEAEIINMNCTSMTGGVINDKHNTRVDNLSIIVDDVVFEDVGDYLTCEITINNNTDDELSVESENISNKSNEYIKYELTSNGDNKISKGENKKFVLDIKYFNEYEESKIIDNNIIIDLSGGVENAEKVENPNTSSFYFALPVVGLILSIIVFGVSIKKKRYLGIFVIMFTITFCSTSYALTKFSIKLDNKIIIDTSTKYGVYYIYPDWLTLEETQDEKYTDVVLVDDICDGRYFYYDTNKNENYKLYFVTVKEGTYNIGDVVAMVDYESRYDAYSNNYLGEKGLLLNKSKYYYWLYSDFDYEALNFSDSGDKIVSKYNGVPTIDVRLPMFFTMPNYDVTFYFDGTFALSDLG